uniref:Uncharacterized protein n=1 Tax=Panagrellus redivivus TaxID=6233 RepID=A0A7E4W0R7_PANRE
MVQYYYYFRAKADKIDPNRGQNPNPVPESDILVTFCVPKCSCEIKQGKILVQSNENYTNATQNPSNLKLILARIRIPSQNPTEASKPNPE